MASISFGEREGQVVDIDISFAQPVEPKPRVPNLVKRPNVAEALDPNQLHALEGTDTIIMSLVLAFSDGFLS